MPINAALASPARVMAFQLNFVQVRKTTKPFDEDAELQHESRILWQACTLFGSFCKVLRSYKFRPLALQARRRMTALWRWSVPLPYKSWLGCQSKAPAEILRSSCYMTKDISGLMWCDTASLHSHRPCFPTSTVQIVYGRCLDTVRNCRPDSVTPS